MSDRTNRPNAVLHRLMHMPHVLRLLVFVCVVLAISSCSKKDAPSPPTMHRTVIVYMVADNNLTSFAQSDIYEMKTAAKSIPKGCQLILYIDDDRAPRIIEFNAEAGVVEHEHMEECNSADPRVMRQQLQHIISQYPSDHYALVLWSHASGWIPPASTTAKLAQRASLPRRSIFIDNSWQAGDEYSSEMSIPDFRAALEQLTVKHWDYIFFDACHMQSIESDYELRHLTDYIIASPAEIPGTGAPYDIIMPALMQDDDAPIAIAQAYHQHYPARAGVLLSVVKTDQLDNLLQITKQLVPDLYEQAPALHNQPIQTYGPYHYTSKWRPEYHDMASALHMLLDNESYEQWKAQMQKTVILALPAPAWTTAFVWSDFTPSLIDPDHLALLSLFLPHPKYDEHRTFNADIQETEWWRSYHN